MTVHHQILGAPGRDNALLVRIDSGQAVVRLLFDCGEGYLSGLAISEIQALDHLFFSHLHTDHVAGFDSFFRCNYNRVAKPNVIWGPPQTAMIMQHRFRGYWWLKELKQPAPGAEQIEIDKAQYDLPSLRRELLVESPGQSIAYLTDFLLDELAADRLTGWLAGCETVVCEAQYRHDDLDLARRNCHTTTKLVAQLAAQARVSRLVLFHLSDRYLPSDWQEMLEECKTIFPNTEFPKDWKWSS